MIPKTIHYCWFGKGQMLPLALKCIESWKKIMPEYTLKLWSEDNFDINSNRYVKEAYENKKFAFVTDYVRLYALYTEGGVYMDTDVEALKTYDEFLNHTAFSGFETDGNVPTGMMAAEKDSLWAKELLSYYDNRSFVKPNGDFDMTTNTSIITNYMLAKGIKLNNTFQEFPGLVVMYPSEYFCPKDHRTGEIKITSNSCCIHHFAMSWINPKVKRLSDTKKKLMKILGVNFVNKLIEVFKLRQIKERILK